MRLSYHCRPRFYLPLFALFAAYVQKFRLSKLFLLNHELNIRLTSLFSVIFIPLHCWLEAPYRRIASQTREGIFALSVSYSKVWKTLNIESNGYWEMCHPWCIIFMAQPQLCPDISYTGWGIVRSFVFKGFSRHPSRRMQRLRSILFLYI